MAQLNTGLVPFVIFQGIGTSIAKKTYSFVIFRRGGGGGPEPSGYAHALTMYCVNIVFIICSYEN